MKNKSLLLSCLLIFLSLSAFTLNDDPITALLKKLEEFTNKYPQEKIHLHLDKPHYSVGDDIWFNAYVVNTKTGEPTQTSNIIYVELINESNTISKQLKLQMKGGIAWGDFKLSDTLNEGNYRIRAYTQLMRNAGAEFFYDKTIKIGDSWLNEVFVNTSTQQNANEIINTISFKNKQNTNYANCEVNYILYVGAEQVGKGKGNTNQNGDVKIITPNPLGKPARIVATITLPNNTKMD